MTSRGRLSLQRVKTVRFDTCGTRLPALKEPRTGSLEKVHLKFINPNPKQQLPKLGHRCEITRIRGQTVRKSLDNKHSFLGESHLFRISLQSSHRFWLGSTELGKMHILATKTRLCRSRAYRSLPRISWTLKARQVSKRFRDRDLSQTRLPKNQTQTSLRWSKTKTRWAWLKSLWCKPPPSKFKTKSHHRRDAQRQLAKIHHYRPAVLGQSRLAASVRLKFSKYLSNWTVELTWRAALLRCEGSLKDWTSLKCCCWTTCTTRSNITILRRWTSIWTSSRLSSLNKCIRV